MTREQIEGGTAAPVGGGRNDVQIEAILSYLLNHSSEGVIADVGDAGTFTIMRSGRVPLETLGAETRTLADAAAPGLTLDLYLRVDGGNCVVTALSPINEVGDVDMTFDTVGDYIRLVSIEDGADFEWRVVANPGVALA